MGCLFELFFEILFEGIIELIVYCYIKLMTLIVPDKVITDKTKKMMKNVITIISVILGLVLIIGVIFLIQDDADIRKIGNYMTYIPLSIIVLQIIGGIIVKIGFKAKKH